MTAHNVIHGILAVAVLLTSATLPADEPPMSWSPEDAELIARVIWSEARGECYEGQLAVAQTIIDRVADGRWGDTVSSVVHWPNQFASPGRLTDELLEVAVAALEGERYLPDYEILFFRMTSSTGDWYSPYIEKIGCHALYGYERPVKPEVWEE